MSSEVVNIRFDCFGLGDNIAFMPYVEEYRKKTGKIVLVSTFTNELFAPVYPKLIFVEPNNYIRNIEKIYIGVEVTDSDRGFKGWRNLPLQQTPCEVLGLEYEPIKPRVHVPEIRIPFDNYVCITENTTRKSKHWLRGGAWQKIVDWLNESSIKVVVCSKEPTNLKGVIDRTGDFPITNRAALIKGARAMISPSTGLAWLAYAVNTPCVMISGSTAEWHEFDCFRVINKDVCNSCINDEKYTFEETIGCPTNKDFECSKKITEEMVLEQLIKAINYK